MKGCPSAVKSRGIMITPVSNALFDIDTYDGAIISDLFGEERHFANEKQFWEYQSLEIALIIEQYRSDGWQDVVLLDVGKHWCSWEHGSSSRIHRILF